jgi:YVTN family beta-propeller protein
MRINPLHRIVWTLAIGLAPSACASAQNAASSSPASPAYAYVANQDAASVSVIDTDARSVVATVDLQRFGFAANARPHHTAVEPDGAFWYVTLIGGGAVLKFNRANALVGRADFEVPGLLAVHPTRDLLIVGRSMMAVNPPQRIGIIRRSDMSIEEVDIFFARPHALAMDPRGEHVYVGSLAANQMATSDLEQERLELSDLPGDPHVYVQFAVSPDGRRLVATGQLSGKLLVFDTTDPMSPTLTTTVDVGRGPWHPVFTPDGREVYVGNLEDNTVSVVETEGWTVTNVIRHEGFAQPHGSGVTPDGRYVYISNRNVHDDHSGGHMAASTALGRVVVIDTRTHAVVSVIETGPYSAGMSIGPQ